MVFCKARHGDWTYHLSVHYVVNITTIMTEQYETKRTYILRQTIKKNRIRWILACFKDRCYIE